MIYLSKKNTDLLDSLDYYKRKTDIFETPFHTNSSYVTKMVKESNSEMKTLKEQIEARDDEISRLKESLAVSFQTIKGKNEQIERLSLV